MLILRFEPGSDLFLSINHLDLHNYIMMYGCHIVSELRLLK